LVLVGCILIFGDPFFDRTQTFLAVLFSFEAGRTLLSFFEVGRFVLVLSFLDVFFQDLISCVFLEVNVTSAFVIKPLDTAD
jgi:hypothetical protein